MGESGKRLSLFSRLRSGLEEGIQFTRGALNLRTTLVPLRPPDFLPKDVIRLRKRINMSQVLFARMLNVSAKTVQSWEQGERRPSQAALRLLQILNVEPKVVFQIVGLELPRVEHIKRCPVTKP